MGFYGNIANTSRTTFQFDKIYPNYYSMINAVEEDGIFLGRYVLVSYDEQPIEGYYNSTDGKFYTTDAHIPGSEIPGKAGFVYKNLHTAFNNNAVIFYTFDRSSNKFLGHTDTTNLSTYAVNYKVDINYAGRAYDNTVWIKQFDTATEKYKYANIANLNSVVPDMSLFIDPPQPIGVTPYFDADSTNLNYYLHLTPSYGFRLGKTTGLSDESISYLSASWDHDANGIAFPHYTSANNIKGDIYYNKAGFNKATRSSSSEANTISTYATKSGLTYPVKDNRTDAGTQANDTYDLKIRLPIIGNIASTAWDLIYGPASTTARYYKTTTPAEISATADLNLYDTSTGLYMFLDAPIYTEDPNGDYVNIAGTPSYYRLSNRAAEAENTVHFTQTIQHRLVHLEDYDLNSIRGALHTVANTLGVADPTRRDLTTAIGAINVMKDIVASIDRQLVPNRLVITGPAINGVTQIQTSDTLFPNTDGTLTLLGNGAWESRLKTIRVISHVDTETIESTDATVNLVSDSKTTNSKVANGIIIGSGNKWITLTAATTNDHMNIAHTLLADTTMYDHNFADDVSMATALTTVQKNNSITFPVFTIDKAGHVIGKSTKTFYIPHTFQSIALDNTSTATTELANQGGDTQTADSITDTFTIATGNKWITAAIADDKLTLAHKVFAITTPTGTDNLSNHGSFITYETSYDTAGHITNYKTVTHYFPWVYDSITLENNTDSKIQATSSGNLNINTDNWLTLTKGEGQSFTISHSTPDALAPGERKINETSVQFGAKFTIPDFTLDAQGHMTGYSTHQVQVQLPSLTQGTGNLVTSVALTPATGAFSVSRANLDTITLASFTAKGDVSGAITNADTLATAINKIVNNLAAEAQTRSNADTTLTNNLNAEVQNRSNADATLTTNLNAEIQNRAQAILDLKDNASNDYNTLGKLESNLKTTKSTLTDTINTNNTAQSNALAAAISNLKGSGLETDYNTLTKLQDYIKGLRADLTDEIAARAAADEDLIDALDGVETTLSNNLTSAINGLKDGVSADYATLKLIGAAIETLKTNLNNEINTNRPAAISAAINQEVTDRTAAINQEVTNRTTAISQEVSARDAAISAAINQEVSNRTTAINQEASARDTAISNAISQEVTNRDTAITAAVSAETQARTAALTPINNAIAALQAQDIPEGLPEAPAEDGLYVLKCSRNGADITYEWVPEE